MNPSNLPLVLMDPSFVFLFTPLFFQVVRSSVITSTMIIGLKLSLIVILNFPWVKTEKKERENHSISSSFYSLI
jgi:hypothetical protein